MATIKIKSNPYERKIEYLSYKEHVSEWENIQKSNQDAFYGCPVELVISYNGASYNKENIEDVK